MKVPETHALVKEYRDLPFAEVQKLLENKWHEVRLCGFFILVEQYNGKKATQAAKDAVLNLYIANAKRANNWDLVDLSCYKILGKWFVESTATTEEKQFFLDFSI